jgi:hypothetical protein
MKRISLMEHCKAVRAQIIGPMKDNFIDYRAGTYRGLIPNGQWFSRIEDELVAVRESLPPTLCF